MGGHEKWPWKRFKPTTNLGEKNCLNYSREHPAHAPRPSAARTKTDANGAVIYYRQCVCQF